MYFCMESKNKKSLVIVGGGPAAMILACMLDSNIFDITLIEKEKTLGRKFLVAGKGGFNLTHSEPMVDMIQKYKGFKSLNNALSTFNNVDFRDWLLELGIETYIGSSKRVFPIKGIKPIEVLNAIIKKIKSNQVSIETETVWSGSFINGGYIESIHKGKSIFLKADKIVFAMGGGSWKITGSDGKWLDHFKERGICTIPFRPSNCALHVKWPEPMKIHIGKPIKNISLSYKGKSIKGEMMITDHGIEGSPAYALSYNVGDALQTNNVVDVYVDLKPTLSLDKIRSTLSKHHKKMSRILRDELSLSSTAVALIKSITSREEFSEVKLLSALIKNLPLAVTGLSPIDEAISTVGGVGADAIDDNMELIDYPNHYVIGEMLDWNGPTGGYLLQACFSMGSQLAYRLNQL